MRVESINATHTPATQQPRGNAHAYGLVRRLQDGSFRGASLDKHLARFGDRIAHVDEVDEEDASAPSQEIEIAEGGEVGLTPILPSFNGLGDNVNILA